MFEGQLTGLHNKYNFYHSTPNNEGPGLCWTRSAIPWLHTLHSVNTAAVLGFI